MYEILMVKMTSEIAISLANIELAITIIYLHEVCYSPNAPDVSSCSQWL